MPSTRGYWRRARRRRAAFPSLRRRRARPLRRVAGRSGGTAARRGRTSRVRGTPRQVPEPRAIPGPAPALGRPPDRTRGRACLAGRLRLGGIPRGACPPAVCPGCDRRGGRSTRAAPPSEPAETSAMGSPCATLSANTGGAWTGIAPSAPRSCSPSLAI